jgi:hypothetical protein
MTPRTISFCFTRPGARIPTKSLDSDTFDLYSPVDIRIKPNEFVYIKTGVNCAIPAGFLGVVAGIPSLLENSLVINGEMISLQSEIIAVACNVGFETIWLCRHYPMALLAIVKNFSSTCVFSERIIDKKVKPLKITNRSRPSH